MLESRMFATSCIVKNSKLVAKARLSSLFPYKSLRNGYHELKMSQGTSGVTENQKQKMFLRLLRTKDILKYVFSLNYKKLFNLAL